ncbi:recombinase family protein [Lysinibacillus sp. NPDC097195]|uniref:recombinase family protein n=1 Tax=Lysinibacillus sp. NPDC097195 TaxID=3364141 RepID=UPI003819B259
MIYGYIRPLYDDETCDQQLKVLSETCQTIYRESHGSPKKRTQLEEMLMTIQQGDTILVERMLALADTTRHLQDILKICEKDGVTIIFRNEKMDSNQTLSLSLQQMLNHYIQFQTDVAKQSAFIGISNAKEQGKTLGRPRKPDINIQKALAMYHSGNFTLHDIKNETGISKSTLYRYLETQDTL